MKSLGQAFSKACRVLGQRPKSRPQARNSFSPFFWFFFCGYLLKKRTETISSHNIPTNIKNRGLRLGSFSFIQILDTLNQRMPTRVAFGQLGAVVVAADRSFHVVACHLGQHDGMISAIQVEHGVAWLEFLNKAALHCFDALFLAIRQIQGQINKGCKRS